MKKGEKKSELEKIVWELKSIEDKLCSLELRQEELRDRYYQISGEQYEWDYRDWMFEN